MLSETDADSLAPALAGSLFWPFAAEFAAVSPGNRGRYDVSGKFRLGRLDVELSDRRRGRSRRPRQKHLGRFFAFAGAGEGRRYRRRRLRPLSSLAGRYRAARALRLHQLSLLDGMATHPAQWR